MAFVVFKLDDGYGFDATPPHSRKAEAHAGPLTMQELIAVGGRLDIPVQDFWYAIQLADPDDPALWTT